MKIDALNTATQTVPRAQEPGERLLRDRQQQQDGMTPTPPEASKKVNQIQPEELLNQIKALTEDGLYSVRFEKDDTINELIVKVVDRDTDEVIRQIPPEEMINLVKHLRELRGDIIDTMT